jgi:N-acetylglucosamine kinase-like BadF-type ATPase
MSHSDKIKTRIESSLDELQMLSYDNGWNAVLDELNRCITEKHLANDRIAVEVLVWARGRIADLSEVIE